MQYQTIDLDLLKVGKTNVRKRGGNAIDDLLPSIRALGLLQPLLVRANGEGAAEGYEIVAGQRRYHALCKLAQEDDAEGSGAPVPCLVMEDGDDAGAIEASLAENIARLPMDEIDQYQAFAAMLREGRDVETIAARFGTIERLVRQRLAIANLIGPILTLYRNGEIDPGTLRHLTLATKTQQKAWLALYRDDEQWAPTGRALKGWLFGGAEISTEAALFDTEAYPGEIVSDLFNERRYFADAQAFWPLQSEAVAEMRDAYLAKGWSEVLVLDIGEQFQRWDYVDTAKKDGGKVVIAIAANGEVTAHEGVMTRKEAMARKRRKEGKNPTDTVAPKPEITQAMQTYLNLHRHAAVRLALLDHPQIALRLLAAHVLFGSPLWRIDVETQRAGRNDIAESVEASPAHRAFVEVHAELEALTADGDGRGHGLAAVFARLLDASDEAVIRILTLLMARSLEAGTGLVEILAGMMEVDMSKSWTPDETYLELLRDKAMLNAMVAEIAGEGVARANLTATAKVQRRIIADCIAGERSCAIDNWHPRHMAVPMAAWRDDATIPVIRARNAIAPLFEKP